MHEPPASSADCEEEGLRGIRLSQYRSPTQRLFQFLNTGVRTASEPRKSQICRAQELYCKAGRESHPCCEGLQAHQMLFPAYWGLWWVGFPSMSKWNHFVDKIILKIKNPNTLLTSSFCSSQHVFSLTCQSLVQHHTKRPAAASAHQVDPAELDTALSGKHLHPPAAGKS